jgi:hypothetical protein
MREGFEGFVGCAKALFNRVYAVLVLEDSDV